MRRRVTKMMAKNNPTIVLMLKAPRLGAVKTRLARDVGNERATGIYRLLVERQMSELPNDWPVEIHFSPADAESEMRQWLGASYRFMPQCHGDLGVRLIHAAQQIFKQGGERLIFLGGDCPEVTSGILRECADRLTAYDTVIGPAHDGGYYLLGLTRFEPRIFENIGWSTAQVLEQTLARLGETNLTSYLLPTFEDVDDLASWRRAAPLLGQSSTAT